MTRRRIPTSRFGVLAVGMVGLLLALSHAASAEADFVVAMSDSSVANHPSATQSLPPTFKVIGGGARANWTQAGSMLTQSQPSGPGTNGWSASAKDHLAAEPVSITAFAIGITDPKDEWEVIVREARSAVAPHPVAAAALPPGYVMTGGGCLDDWRTSPNAAGNLLTASFPSSTNSWECRGKDHGVANPASIVAYVIGIRPRKPGVPLPELQITTASSSGTGLVTALAPALPGFVVTGGGALTRDAQQQVTIGSPPGGTIINPGRMPPRQQQSSSPGQLLTATHPEIARGAARASGWRASAKDHVYASPGIVEAFALNLRFGPPLMGWADLHTHPMINLAFGGKLIHGSVDVGSFLPADSKCNRWTQATSVEQALGDDRPSHGGKDLHNFPCGDEFRPTFIMGLQAANGALVTAGPGRAPADGFPDFRLWPAWNDITHQKMWWEWIKRARDGGQRVMVALATNNRTLGDAVSGDGPTDDKTSADLQLREMKTFVGRHSDFMEVALSPADLDRIVRAGKMAVVLGIEIDNIGNLNDLPPNTPGLQDLVAREIKRLYDDGVRYVLPIHVVDNLFGGSAIYEPLYNLANLRENKRYFDIVCSAKGDDIAYKHPASLDTKIVVAAMTKLGLYSNFNPPPVCPQPKLAQGVGHRNDLDLLPLGEFAVKEMMKLGMIIDIDHMSDKAVDQTLTLAEGVGAPVGYPINSGHSGIRGLFNLNKENHRSRKQLLRIARLHGIFGLGTDGTNANSWSRHYQAAMSIMGYMSSDPALRAYQNGAIAFGTDLNGLVKGAVPPGGTRVTYDSSLPPPNRLGNKTWNYNDAGLAHYGLLPDFVRDVSMTPRASNSVNEAGQPINPVGEELVYQHLLLGADYFYRMWQRCEAQRGQVR